MKTQSKADLKTVRQIAGEMGMTSANVRYHLRKWRGVATTLEGVTFVDAAKFKRRMTKVVTRGRPRGKALAMQAGTA